jgi:hypothetical protein
MYGALNDPYFVLLVLSCAAVITIGAIVTALNRIPRAEFARLQNKLDRLQNKLKTLSERVGVLEAAEQKRFLSKINSPSEGAEAKYTANGRGVLEAEGGHLSRLTRGPLRVRPNNPSGSCAGVPAVQTMNNL